MLVPEEREKRCEKVGREISVDGDADGNSIDGCRGGDDDGFNDSNRADDGATVGANVGFVVFPLLRYLK